MAEVLDSYYNRIITNVGSKVIL